MKRLVCCLVLLFFSVAAFSQRLYFIYLQAEPEQPFFVKMNSKVFSSSASGYLILSRLRDSSYAFSVGFPQNKWPEQYFKVDIKAKDHGFLLKNFGEKGWGLFDLQTLSVQMAEVPADKAVRPELKEVSAFTDVLAKAANDPSLREKPVLVSQPESVAIQPAVDRTDETQNKEQTVVQALSITEPVIKEDTPVASPEIIREEPKIIPAEDYKPSLVTRKSESSTSQGFGLTFVDEYADGTKDTIRIMIPNQRSLTAVVKEEPKEEKKFLDITTDAPDKLAESKAPVDKAVVKTPVTGNYCADTTSETDFRKLRRKMASQDDDDGMVREAEKFFKSKCVTVAQVKNLSALFLLDSGKYKFFDAAYGHVGDIDNFAGLQSELSDKYYVNRFRAMLRN
jgi:hypothetical protein